MTGSVEHGQLTVEREFAYPLDRVYAAWTTAEAKSRWFAQSDADFIDRQQEYSLDFRVGGQERMVARLKSGKRLEVETRFWDIVPKERIVATYDVLLDDRRLSVSLWSVIFIPTEKGTKLITVEDGAFLDGLDNAESRREGVEWDFDHLEAYLAETAPVPA
jgi:uncharacterized protein YndB with AHSA1/START domain